MTQSDQIRTAALRLFAEHGYRSTTMADIGAAVGMRGPSLYKHISSKQELLAQIMTSTMDELIRRHHKAIAGCGDAVERLRRATESHVRFHVRHREEAFVGTREIRALVAPYRRRVLVRRTRYENAFRRLIDEGCRSGAFQVASAKLASYAILDLGMGTAVWYRASGELSEDEVVYQYGEFALRLVNATTH